MHAGDKLFRQIIEGRIQFVVPVFQRDYKWGAKEWQRLWDDINRAGSDSLLRNPDAGHFLGSLTQINTGRSTPSLSSWLVIDGQQRLATLTILVTALRDYIAETGWFEDGGPTADLLDDLFLKNRHEKGNGKYKLSLRRADDATLHAFVDGKDLGSLESVPSGQVAAAYEFFRERLRNCNPAMVYNSIASLKIVEVTLNRDYDDPQFVFESLNDTGVDLSPGDMVRNYLLMRLEEQEQTRLYTEYWSKIEGHFRDDKGQINDGEFNSFLQNYLALKRRERRRPAPANRIYEEFKRYKDTLAETALEELLADIRRFAGYYAAFQGRAAIPSPGLADAMRYTRRRGTAPMPLLLRLWDCFDYQRTLTEKEFIQVLGIIESYLLRRTVMGFQTRWNSYWSIFAGLAHSIGDKPLLEHLRREIAAIENWNWHWRFPRDGEFAKELQERDLYRLGIICKRILERLENFETKEPSPTAHLSIEHIMPQQPGQEWQEMLGDAWREIHSAWLHRLGNLTLTGYNPEMSNRPFEDKKTIPGGFKESAVRLNQPVAEQPKWTATEMETRGNRLAQQALRIWPYPRSNAA